MASSFPASRLRMPLSAAAVFALAASLAFFEGAVAQSETKGAPAKFFSQTDVLRISLEIAPKELDALRREPRKYARATLKVGQNETYKDVGIHVKGAAGSYRGIDDKPGLTLNMNKFNEGQRFHGIDKFHLANSVQDPSYVNELICGELFRAAGVPASHVRHAIVTINGRGRGFYYLKEGYDRGFLRRNFGSANGNFYDGGFLRDIDQPLQLLSRPQGKVDHADLKALVAATRIGDGKKRLEAMGKLLDVERFISYMVMESLTWDWDGYPINRNNYRIYHDPKSDRLVFLPSGMDQMFGDPNGPALPGFNGMVARAIVDTPDGRTAYLKRCRELLDKVFRPEQISKRLEQLEASIRPALASVDAGAGRDYPNQIQRIKNAVKQRAKSVDEQLKRMKF